MSIHRDAADAASVAAAAAAREEQLQQQVFAVVSSSSSSNCSSDRSSRSSSISVRASEDDSVGSSSSSSSSSTVQQQQRLLHALEEAERLATDTLAAQQQQQQEQQQQVVWLPPLDGCWTVQQHVHSLRNFKVCVHLTAVGDAARLRVKAFVIDGFEQIDAVLRFLQKTLKRTQLHVYINSCIKPQPSEYIADLFQKFSVGGRLLMSYSYTQAF